jgi:quercetin dioxygenase-like cupin family protein
MRQAAKSIEKQRPVATVANVKDLPTYFDMHGNRQLKILFDDENGGAESCALEYITYQKGDEVRMHKHDDAEHAFFIIKGKGFFECDSGRYDIQEGSVMFMPKGANHRIGNNGDGEMVLLEIFAPPTVARKTSLATCYAIPKWKEHFDPKIFKEKEKFAKERGAKPSAKLTYGNKVKK